MNAEVMRRTHIRATLVSPLLAASYKNGLSSGQNPSSRTSFHHSTVEFTSKRETLEARELGIAALGEPTVYGPHGILPPQVCRRPGLSMGSYPTLELQDKQDHPC